MKKLTLITLILSSSLFANANSSEPTKTSSKEMELNDDKKKKLTVVRDELTHFGFSNQMMNDLFGDENFYFPTTREKLNTSFYIIDKLIENKQYAESDKEALVSLAKKAFNAYSRREIADSMTN